MYDKDWRTGTLRADGVTEIKYGYFDSLGYEWTSTEIQSVEGVLDYLQSILNIEFTLVTEYSEADTVYRVDNVNTEGGFPVDGTYDLITGSVSFNRLGVQCSTTAVIDEGWAYHTILHETLHSLGLKHPWESYGWLWYDGPSMDGANDAYDLGSHGLNSLLSTAVAYRHFSTDPGGVPSSLMALDLAALDHLYGLRGALPQQGDNGVLDLASLNWSELSTIHADLDRLVYSGTEDAIINLNDATLAYDAGGAGYASFVTYQGGHQVKALTIANGVEVDEAAGGGGSDDITGNERANVLAGNGANDIIRGGAGTDTAVFTGTWSDYKLLFKKGIFTIEDQVSGRDGKDTLFDIEMLRFSGGLELSVSEAINVAPGRIELGTPGGQPPSVTGHKWMGMLSAEDPNNDNSANRTIDSVSFTIKPGQSNGGDYDIVDEIQLYRDTSAWVDPVAWEAAMQSIHASVIGSAMSYSAWMQDVADGHSSLNHSQVVAQLASDYKLTVTATDSGGLATDTTLILQFPVGDTVVHVDQWGFRYYYGGQRRQRDERHRLRRPHRTVLSRRRREPHPRRRRRRRLPPRVGPGHPLFRSRGRI
jgi:hypothetical protein